jgi:16S rRNA (guanine(966)-N(2))-methyltransferase RsmD
LKVSGGTLKGRTIKTPKGTDTRPTSGITRESIFNIIKNKVSKAFILDLYSGSGSFGIEALSRGADFCVFTENSKEPLRCIKENIQKLNLEKNSSLLKKTLPQDLKTIISEKNFDIVFLDPPYSKNLINSTLKELKSFPFIDNKTTIIAEHSKHEFPDPSVFEIIDTRKYGKSLVSFLNCVL